MDYQILEEKYKSIVNKLEHEKKVLQNESETLKKKLENLEGAYFELECKNHTYEEEKESIEEMKMQMEKENENLKSEISALHERIEELKELSKAYKKMVKNRNEELTQTELLIDENMNLKSNMEKIQNEKKLVENELKQKKKVINIIKDKYKKNIGRILEKLNEKDRDIKEFKTYILNELGHLRSAMNEANDPVVYDESNQLNNGYTNDKYMNLNLRLEQLTKKLEESLTLSNFEK